MGLEEFADQTEEKEWLLMEEALVPHVVPPTLLLYKMIILTIWFLILTK